MNQDINERKTTFWDFINKQKIEIPIIQRDYAQGRKGKEFLRKNFISDLKCALDPENKKPLVLDFVYGIIEEGRFIPIDGQQRLTTLWILHWYIAYRSGELKKTSTQNILKNFSYETRVSSRKFINKLCEYCDEITNEGIVSRIENQTWFYANWKHDPTIQSMLSIIGGSQSNSECQKISSGDNFESAFKDTKNEDFKRYWDILTNSKKIVFFYIPLKDFGLSDDLYVKMNARGKILTSFENLKSDLVGYIKKKCESLNESEQCEWRNLRNIPGKLDTTWTDIFWNHRSAKLSIDKIYFAFINRFFWNELFDALLETQNIEKNEYYKYFNDENVSYKSFDLYKCFDGEIPIKFFQRLTKILDNYKKFIDEKGELPSCKWNDSFHFIPIYKDSGDEEKISTLSQPLRVVFFAYCKFFAEIDEGETGNDVISISQKLKRWMRVVWNLVSGEDSDKNDQIRTVDGVKTAIKFVKSLDSQDVYNSLKYYKELGDSVFDERCKEEIEKAKKIIKEPAGWEDKIIGAEEYAFFKGAIGFLFRNENGYGDWDNFDKKLKNAQNFFDKDGVKNFGENKYKDESILLKAALYYYGGDNCYTEIEGGKFVLDNTKDIWLNNFLLNKKWAKAVHKILLGDEIHSLPERNDDYIWYKSLYSSNLLNNVANKQEGSRVRWTHYHLAIYQPYKEGIVLDSHDFFRNEILSSLLKEQEIGIKEDIIIKGNESFNFFKGWNIDFTYKDKNFQWNIDDKIYATSGDYKKPLLNTKEKEYDKQQLKKELLKYLDSFIE